MDDRDRSRSPMAPVASPVVVSNINAEEMDGTENYGTVTHRPSERRQVRPGEGRRAEVGVIQRGPRLVQHHLLQPQQPAAAAAGMTMGGRLSAAAPGPGHPSSSSGPSPLSPPPPIRPATRRDWFEYSVARTSTIATLNAATALGRAIAAFVAAAAAAPATASGANPAPREPDPRPPATQNPAPDPSNPGAVLTAIARARMGASERLKTIAASLNDRPPRKTVIVQEARNEAVERIRTEVARIEAAAEREETSRMLDRILAPGSLHSIRALYERMPAWQENGPPPVGWPFTLPGQRAAMQQRQTMIGAAAGGGGSTAREREYTRDSTRRNRHTEANDAARDIFEELIANGLVHASGNAHVPRLPRTAPSLLPSFENVQQRDLPAMLSVQQARGVPPEHRVDEGEEQVVPTGPSMRAPHTVPVLNSQTRMRENYEQDYRRRISVVTTDAIDRHRQWAANRADERARSAMDRGEEPPPRDTLPSRPPAQRPTDTPHPRARTEEMNGASPMLSPLVMIPISPGSRERLEQMERDNERLRNQRPHLRSADPSQRRFLGRGSAPTDSALSQARDTDDEPGPSTSRPTTSKFAQAVISQWAAEKPAEKEPKIIVHKLRSTHRGPGQRREANSLVGARHLIMEHKALQEKGGVERVEAAPKPDNVRTWTAVVEGAEGSQFEGGVFFFDLFFPLSYPMGKVKMACLTHIVHPYVMRSGMVDMESVAKLCYDVKQVSEIKYGGVERSLMIAAALVSGKLPESTPEQRKQWIERGRLFTTRYAC